MKNDENKKSDFDQVLEAISSKKHFLIVSHARPDGDAIGSQLALSYALKQIGKLTQVVCRDEPPAYFRLLPGLSDIIFTDSIEETFDAVIVLECGSLERTEIEGLDKQFLINIDHHVGNSMYGAVNWFDETAAACGEMVFRIITALGIPLGMCMGFGCPIPCGCGVSNCSGCGGICVGVVKGGRPTPPPSAYSPLPGAPVLRSPWA